MKRFFALLLISPCSLLLHAEDARPAVAPPYYEVSYEPSAVEGELKIGVTYTLWVPPGVKELRGVIVHQHGCGEGACKGGETAAYDLHWQALARKWDCALLGPSYHQSEKQKCDWWCDPNKGSDKTFLKALTDLATKSGHAEVAQVPWCLWGHSGGANWASLMLALHPERIMAVWLRSGAPHVISAAGVESTPEMPAAAYEVPVMCNVGVKEKEGRFAKTWMVTIPFFKNFRAKGGLIGYAPDPRTSHECGDSRYLAIPFFDVCLAQRLPDKGTSSETPKPMDRSGAWLAPLLGDTAQPAASFTGDVNESVWLPNERVAHAWSEYVKTGTVSDTSPPPAPTHVQVNAGELTWESGVDFESGLGGFVIERDGAEIGHLPEKPDSRFGRPLFQRMSYHDTPEKPLPVMHFTDATAKPGETHQYRVRAINSAGLRSKAVGP